MTGVADLNWDTWTSNQGSTFDGGALKIYQGSQIPVTTGEFKLQTS